MKFLVALLLIAGIFGSAVAQTSADLKSTAETQVKADLEKTAKLEKAYQAAKAAYTKKPTDAALKTKYTKATNDYAHSVMVSSALLPKDKYPLSLRLYRETLKVDPKNKEAITWKTKIEDIYKSLGRPIPK